MSKRAVGLALCRIAGYHEDKKVFTKAYLEHGLSMSTAQEAYNIGYKSKVNGMSCSCSICKE